MQARAFVPPESMTFMFRLHDPLRTPRARSCLYKPRSVSLRNVVFSLRGKPITRRARGWVPVIANMAHKVGYTDAVSPSWLTTKSRLATIRATALLSDTVSSAF